MKKITLLLLIFFFISCSKTKYSYSIIFSDNTERVQDNVYAKNDTIAYTEAFKYFQVLYYTYKNQAIDMPYPSDFIILNKKNVNLKKTIFFVTKNKMEKEYIYRLNHPNEGVKVN